MFAFSVYEDLQMAEVGEQQTPKIIRVKKATLESRNENCHAMEDSCDDDESNEQTELERG